MPKSNKKKSTKRIILKSKPLYQKVGEKSYNEGDFIYYFGHPYIIRFSKTERSHLDHPTKTIVIQTKALETKDSKTRVLELLKKEMLVTTLELVTKYTLKYGVEYKAIRIKKMTSRWGSCSSLKNLNFNLQLIGAPIEIFEYIIVHEVCHLMILDHSSKFWELVSENFPEWKAARKWLKINGYKLNLDLMIKPFE